MKCVEMLFKDCYQPLIIISIEHEQNKSVYINLYSFMVSKIKLRDSEWSEGWKFIDTKLNIFMVHSIVEIKTYFLNIGQVHSISR